MDKALEHRRQEALAVAEQCAQILKSRFGAGWVIPFGSVVGDGPWHEKSDLDLAVEGLSSEALWEAERELEAMVPSWRWRSMGVCPRENDGIRCYWAGLG